MSTYELIKSAIQNQQPISATYDGHYRELCPHVIGTKNGTEQCLCYQYGGNTSKGPILSDQKGNWRCMVVAKLQDVTIISGDWHTFENHSRPSSCVDVIDAEVAY